MWGSPKSRRERGMVDLTVEIAGVRFKNPVILGSATPTRDAERIKKGVDGGAAGAIVKSLFGEAGKLGRKYPRPRFKLYDFRDYPGYPQNLPRSFTLRSLEECSSFGYEEYARDIDKTKALVGDDGIVMASLSGSSREEWIEMCRLINQTKADWVELNNSCPFAQDMGVEMGAGAVAQTGDFVRACAEVLNKPFSVKITPQTNDPIAIAKTVEQAGARAVNLSARLSGITIDIETGRPEAFGSMGGYGGPYLLGYGLKWVAQAARVLKIPIIGGLGVWDWRDIIAYIEMGASLVQSGAAIMIKGYKAPGKWVEEMSSWMEAKGYNSLDEIRGMALPHVIKTAEVPRASEHVAARIDTNKCTRCGVCLRSCFYDAITLARVGAVIDSERCDVCGMCVEVCPEHAPYLVNI